jgi:DNA (cytosine-5)-methyltransferase 1
MHNVKNLLSINEGEAFAEVLYQLGEVGYDCEWDCVNSKAYVPQNRERIYIIGFLRNRKRAGKIFPVGGTHPHTVKLIIGGSQTSRVYDSRGISRALTAQSGGFGGKSGLYFVDLCKNPRITDIARCLKARYNSGISNRSCENSGVLCKCRIRKLTPRETFRLQGYEDEQFFRAESAGLSDCQLYKQMGNGVTVAVVRAIGEKIMEIYGGGG